jgi:dihydroorotase
MRAITSGFREMKILILVFSLLLASGVRGQEPASPEIYDILLKNGRVLDPAGKHDGRFDIAITRNKIVRIAPDLPSRSARNTIELSGCLVTAGFIDINAHVDARGAWRSVNADHHALRSGVTTVVDSGSTGWKTFESFKRTVIDRARTRVLAFLNIAAGGISSDGRAGPVEDLDVEQAAGMAQKYPDLIVGIRTPFEDASDWRPLERAVEAAGRGGRVVLADFRAAPSGNYDGLLEKLRSGDIVTAIYGLRTPLLEPQKKVRAPFRQARERGILFDLGHGSDGFWFRIAAPAIKEQVLPDTISSAIDKESALLARADMFVTLSKLLNLGMTLEQLVERVTVRAARAIRRPELGTLEPGGIADIAVFEIERGRFGFVDAGHARLVGDRNLRVILTVRGGQVVWDPDARSRPDWLNAGSYSNYR